jgi:hypothetical protein
VTGAGSSCGLAGLAAKRSASTHRAARATATGAALIQTSSDRASTGEHTTGGQTT